MFYKKKFDEGQEHSCWGCGQLTKYAITTLVLEIREKQY